MKQNEEFFKVYLKLFLTKNLDLPLTEILKLMDVNRNVFYNRFDYYDNFFNLAFDYYFQDLIKKRIKIQSDNIFEIIDQMNSLIIKKLMHYKKIIDFNNLSSNIELFNDNLKKRYKLLILNNIISKNITYRNIKLNTDIILEESYFSLCLHIKYKEVNFSKFYYI